MKNTTARRWRRPAILAFAVCTFLFSVWFVVSSWPPANNPDATLSDFPHFIISTVAGTGIRGFSGDGGAAIKANIQRPTAVAVDTQGNLFIADEQNHRVRKVTPDGLISTVVGTGETDTQSVDHIANTTNLSAPYGIATDHEDNLYVLNRGHDIILKIGSDGVAQRIVGTGVSGFSGDGGPAKEAQICFTNHLAVDSQGSLYIADTGNHRIRKVSTDGTIETIAGTGERGFMGDGGPAIDAELHNPVAIAVDHESNVFIADFSNHRIRKISADGIIETIAGTGDPKFSGEGWPATSSNIGEPCGVAVDRDGNVFIGDQINSRVRVVTSVGLMFTVAGTGRSGRTGDDGPAELARISNPDIIAFDSNGNLFIPDHNNAVIRKLTPVVN
ncbi:MAG: NHL repeat-containing protein [Mariniblastus sp.]